MQNGVSQTYHQYLPFGARYYDSDLSVWLSVDPLSDERAWLSPYNYVQWNPVGRVDPTGALDGHWVMASGQDVGDDGYSDDETYVIQDEAYAGFGKGATAKQLRDNYEANDGIAEGMNKLGISWSSFQIMTRWINGEGDGSGGWKKDFAIGNAIVNWKDWYNDNHSNKLSISQFVKYRMDLVGEDKQAKYVEWWQSTSPLERQRMRASVINALMGTVSYSNDANQWNRKDQGIISGVQLRECGYYSKAYMQGWQTSNYHHTTWKNAIKSVFGAGSFVPNQTMYAKMHGHLGNTELHSTACYGTTIFWKYTNP